MKYGRDFLEIYVKNAESIFLEMVTQIWYY